MNSITAPAPQVDATEEEAMRDLFYQAGLFTIPKFFKPEFCAQLRAEACQFFPQLTQQVIVSDGQSKLDQTIHLTDEVQINPQSWETSIEHLNGLKPQLEQYFQTELSKMEAPKLLRYDRGQFISWHTDTRDDVPVTKRLKIRTLLYLNGQDSESGSESFIGGELEFLIPQEEYKNHCLQISPQTGLLIAFDSLTPHQVQPIAKGTRYVIVAGWR